MIYESRFQRLWDTVSVRAQGNVVLDLELRFLKSFEKGDAVRPIGFENLSNGPKQNGLYRITKRSCSKHMDDLKSSE